ncbi:response regulator [Melittangium boletus]|uniref:Two-component system response regulator n=1 Tax=Melittangium boletus DSM 14713 TaxID=1294270 RepID=A0A250IFU3_9BACT|nr:response regulator [Melittangium boletus]ATB30042.1 two-component system response regulator [Melittangium boletus DSM 14713]
MAQQQGAVLVVEDLELSRKILTGELQALGFTHIVEATNGADALACLAEMRPVPVLVCLDLTLPDISGYDVCEMIRNTPLLQEIPVLMVSARTQTMDRAQAELAGASGYLMKPFTTEELRQQVERVLPNPPWKKA